MVTLRNFKRHPRDIPARVQGYPTRKFVFLGLEGKVYTKGVFSCESSSASTGRKRFFIPRSLFLRERRNTYTPKSFSGRWCVCVCVCGGPLRTVLVCRFWPPMGFKGHAELSGHHPIPPITPQRTHCHVMSLFTSRQSS